MLLDRLWKRARNQPAQVGSGGAEARVAAGAPSVLLDPQFLHELRKIDASFATTEAPDVVALFARVPLDVVGLLQLERPDELPALKAYFPAMPTRELQEAWVGSAGLPLLAQSLAFTRSVVSAFERHGAKTWDGARVLDYGCGWGRLLRLFYKYVPAERLHGMDAWENILDEARRLGVRGHLHRIDEYPQSLPAGPFDLVYAFSVFTHLSEAAARAALSAIHRACSDGAILVATVRPVSYWSHAALAERSRLEVAHRERGYAFVPDPRLAPRPDGDVPYGETSISPERLRDLTQGWEIVELDYNVVDPYQLVVVLRKVSGGA